MPKEAATWYRLEKGGEVTVWLRVVRVNHVLLFFFSFNHAPCQPCTSQQGNLHLATPCTVLATI